MALLFCDSFDHYTTLLNKWTSTGFSISMATTGGRSNGGVMTSNGTYAGGNSGFAQKTHPGGTKSTIVIGFAFRPNGAISSSGIGIAQVIDGTTSLGTSTPQVTLRLNRALGTLNVARGGSGLGATGTGEGGTLLAQGSTVLLPDVFIYVEMKVYVHATAGRVVVRLNGATEIDFTGNTMNTANPYIDATRLGGGDGGFSFDDVVILDNLGTRNNDFMGDCRVEWLKPTGVGALSGWTPNAAGANWTKVSEVPNDGDTTYVSTSVVGTKDTYLHNALTPLAADIKGIQPLLVARKDDAGTRTVGSLFRQGGVNYAVGTTANVSTGYGLYHSIQELNPATSAAFTLAEVNASEIGIDLIS